MTEFKVKIIKENCKPVAVQAAQVNGRMINIILKDEPQAMSWEKANSQSIPTLAEWVAILENIEEVNEALKRAGGEPLKNEHYWSSSELDGYGAWSVRPSDGAMGNDGKSYSNRVRCLYIKGN
jgi:hypothetical protein|nr:MAG TPA: Protein of unknown function (DUF1566) [Caudoviricetes sp.]